MQGCVLAPTLFSIFFNMMIMQVNEDLVNEDNVYVRYRLDGSLFNLSYRAFKLTPRLMRGLSETFSSQMMLMYHFLLRKCCPAFWPRGQPEEDGGPLPACPPRRIPPASHHYQRNQADVSAAVLLPWLYHLIWCQDWQGSRHPKQAVPSADYIKGSGTTIIWRPKPRSVYTGQ